MHNARRQDGILNSEDIFVMQLVGAHPVILGHLKKTFLPRRKKKDYSPQLRALFPDEKIDSEMDIDDNYNGMDSGITDTGMDLDEQDSESELSSWLDEDRDFDFSSDSDIDSLDDDEFDNDYLAEDNDPSYESRDE